MKVCVNTVPFHAIAQGATFRHGSKHFIKTSLLHTQNSLGANTLVNAVMIETGDWTHCPDDCGVVVVPLVAKEEA